MVDSQRRLQTAESNITPSLVTTAIIVYINAYIIPSTISFVRFNDIPCCTNGAGARARIRG